MDLRRFSTIAHSRHRFASPISGARAAHLLAVVGVGKGTLVLDIGCGFGGWASLAHEQGAVVTAVDPNNAFIDRGKARSPGITWVNAEYAPELVESGTQDVVLCIGSTHALGGLEAVLAEAARVLRKDGSVLIGEGFWKRPPDPDYLSVLGAEPDEMVSHAANAERMSDAGWKVVYSTTAGESEWDDYEGLYRHSIVHWLLANASDPEAEAFRARSDTWYETYLNMGRDTLGFGYYIAISAE